MSDIATMYAIACIIGIASVLLWSKLKEANEQIHFALLDSEYWWWCDDGHKCLKPLFGGSEWCAVCTERRLVRSKAFRYMCACPRCGYADTHAWRDISHIEDDGTVSTKTLVIRTCESCEYEWRQS